MQNCHCILQLLDLSFQMLNKVGADEEKKSTDVPEYFKHSQTPFDANTL